MGQRQTGVAFEEWALLAEIRAEMGRRGWSAARMSRESGIPVSNVRRYFMRAMRSPSPSDLFNAARALGVPLSELVERAETITDARNPRDLALWHLDQGDADLSADLHAQLDPATQALAEELRPKRDGGAGEAKRA